MNSRSLAVVILAILGTAIGSMRLWWLNAPRMESRYLWDYVRLTIAMPRIPFWPYRLETVQHLPITALPEAVYGGRPLCVVLLWPLIATITVGIVGLFLSVIFGDAGGQQDRVIRGPRLVTHRQFNFRTIFKRKGAFYIETK